MRVFVTGATGWVGSAVVQELVAHGHSVTGLARAPEKATALAAQGAQVLLGTLDDLDRLQEAAASADAVIHTAFNHDFSRFAQNAEQDQRAIEAFGSVLRGTDKPLVVTSGVALLAPGRLATEEDIPARGPSYPRKSEATARELAAQGVFATTMRLAPSVHGAGDHGFVPQLIAIARRTGVSGYLGEGSNRWAAVHRRDAARAYRLVLEKGTREQHAYHAIADEGVAFRAIAESIGRHLGLPVERREPEHFGWLGSFAAIDMAASSERTRSVLGWQPQEPGLLADLDSAGYFAA
ncbi:SDR family oxidoreductase [Ramlibacter sp. G-1-2-2]|uniref:SDR family oxidoreductase n=1 Tax=Ramlibacter agri TaxID=2728837 RepID=A0A848H5I5_9BURK|nr:SDR family oxidoreductase [Ramlibacter agri]NML44520.1 SDR family oxidoreductase [Ramlibacter agri]